MPAPPSSYRRHQARLYYVVFLSLPKAHAWSATVLVDAGHRRRIIIAAYAICAVLTALSSIFLAMYTRAILPSSHGNVYELYAIAAAVLGGVSLRGGEGSVIGVVLGAILLQVLQNLVNLLGIPSSLNFAVSGSVISIRVLAD